VRNFRSLIVAIVAMTTSSISFAGECVVVDSARDNFSEQDRQAALVLFSNALESHDLSMGEPCDNTWQISHVQLGKSITVRVEAREQVSTLVISVVEDLVRAYSQITNSILTEVPLEAAISRTDVTAEQAEGQRRISTEFLTTLRFGGGMLSPSSGLAPAIGGGMRVELNKWAIDADWSLVFDTHAGREQVGMGGHINVLSFLSPTANHTPYVGGGVGYGLKDVDGADGYGFEGQIVGGYEMFRASKMRLFFQMDAVLPAYTMAMSGGDQLWAPSVIGAIGIAFKPAPKSGSVPWWIFL
jgi:hypothetical protein